MIKHWRISIQAYRHLESLVLYYKIKVEEKSSEKKRRRGKRREKTMNIETDSIVTVTRKKLSSLKISELLNSEKSICKYFC